VKGDHMYLSDQVMHGEPGKGSICCDCGDVHPGWNGAGEEMPRPTVPLATLEKSGSRPGSSQTDHPKNPLGIPSTPQDFDNLTFGASIPFLEKVVGQLLVLGYVRSGKSQSLLGRLKQLEREFENIRQQLLQNLDSSLVQIAWEAAMKTETDAAKESAGVCQKCERVGYCVGCR
jgi:hypothetical protein